MSSKIPNAVGGLGLLLALLTLLSRNWEPAFGKRIAQFATALSALSILVWLCWRLRIRRRFCEFRKRLAGPDLKWKPPGWRHVCWLGAGSHRAFVHACATRAVRLLACSTLIPAVLVAAWYAWVSSCGAARHAHTLRMFLGVWAALLVSFYFSGRLAVRIWDGLRFRRPAHGIRQELLCVIQGWRLNVDVPTILRSDPGPICVYAINYHELLEVNGSGSCPLDELLASPHAKDIKLLVADPTSDATVRRSRRLHGRHVEWNITRFVKIMLRWQVESTRRPNKQRMAVKTYAHGPIYRLLASAHRVAVQRYGSSRHGIEEPPYVLYQTVRVQDPKQIAPGTYMHFREVFDCAFRAAKTESFLDSWDVPRLQRLARLCGISSKTLNQIGDVPRDIATHIVTQLGLDVHAKELHALAQSWQPDP